MGKNLFSLAREMWRNRIPERTAAKLRLSVVLLLAAAIMGTVPLIVSPLTRWHFLVQFTLTAICWLSAILLGVFISTPAPPRPCPGEDPRLRPEILAAVLAIGLTITSALLADLSISSRARQDFRILVVRASDSFPGQEEEFRNLFYHLKRETSGQPGIRIIPLRRTIRDGRKNNMVLDLLRKYHGDILCWEAGAPIPPGGSMGFHILRAGEFRRSGNVRLVNRTPLLPLRCPLPIAFTFISEGASHTRDLALFLSGTIHLERDQPLAAATTLTAAIQSSGPSHNGILQLFRGRAWMMSNEFTRMEKDSAIAVSRTPSMAEGWNQHAIASVKLHDWKRAVEFFQNAASMDPSWPVPHSNRGTTLVNAGRITQAREAYTSALKCSPDDVDSIFNLGILDLEQQDYVRAEQAMSKVINLNPEMVDAHYFRGISRFKKQKYNMALEDFSSTIRAQPSRADTLHDQGVTYARLGKMHMAIHSFTRSLAKSPRNPQTRWMRGLAYFFSGENRLAEADCSRLLKKNKKNVSALTLRGKARFHLGDPFGAAEDFSRLAELDPSNPLHRILLGQALLEADNPTAAARNFSSALKLDSEQPEAWMGRSMARWMIHKRSEALADLDHCLARQPGNFRAWLLSGIFRRQTGNFTTAIKHIRKSMTLMPTHLDSRFQLALTLLLADKVRQASKELNRVIARNPEHDEALNFRGMIRQVSGNIPGAIQDFQQAIMLVPGEPAYRMSLGNTRLILGDNAGAARDYQLAARLIPGDPLPVFFTGQALEDGGRYSEALALYRNALGTVQSATLPLYRTLMRRIKELERDLSRLHAGEKP